MRHFGVGDEINPTDDAHNTYYESNVEKLKGYFKKKLNQQRRKKSAKLSIEGDNYRTSMERIERGIY